MSDMRTAVCLMPDPVFVLFIRQFRIGLRRHRLHHIGGRRVAGGVPCMNPVGVGRARLDGPVAEGRDMRSHPADHRERTGRTDTVSALDAEPESAGPAFGPCEKHLATSDGDRQQIDRHLGKDGRRRSTGHSSSYPLRQGFGRQHLPRRGEEITRLTASPEQHAGRNRLLSETRVAVCPNLGSVFVL